MDLQIPYHGQDHGLVLVIAGEAQRFEIRQTAHMVDEALDVPLHLQSTVPILEGKHGAPVEPEVGVQHFVIEVVGDAFVVQFLIRGKEQAHNLHGRFIRNIKLAVRVGILAPVHGGPTEGVVGVFLVQPVILIQNADTLGFNRGDRAVQVPHDLEMVVHLPTAPHDVAHVLELPAVAGTARDGVLLEDVDVLALHLTIPHQIASGG